MNKFKAVLLSVGVFGCLSTICYITKGDDSMALWMAVLSSVNIYLGLTIGED